MKVDATDEQLTRIVEENIDVSGAMNYQDWLDKIAGEYADDVEEEKQPLQKSKKKSEESQIKIKRT